MTERLSAAPETPGETEPEKAELLEQVRHWQKNAAEYLAERDTLWSKIETMREWIKAQRQKVPSPHHGGTGSTLALVDYKFNETFGEPSK